MARSAYKIPLGGGPPKGTSSTSSDLEWLHGKQQQPSLPAADTTTEETKKKTKPMARSAYKIQLSAAAAGRRPQTTTMDKTSTTNNTTTTKPNTTNPSKFGKADPIRDLLFLVSFLAFLFLVSWVYRDIGKPVDLTKMKAGASPSLGSLKKYQKKMMDSMVSEDRKRLYRYDCPLFLAPSSIKETGLSIFAGKNYSQGDEIMSLGWPFLNLAKEDDPLFLPPYALLLKHHPTLVNVKPSAQTPLWATTTTTIASSSSSEQQQQQQQRVTLIATQPITAGNELFLAFENHPHSSCSRPDFEYLFRRIPTAHDYQEADALIAEERLLFQVKNARSIPKKRSGDVGMGLRMTRNAVARYAPRVAALLPIMPQTLVSYATSTTDPSASSLVMALHPQTHKSLAGYGACLSNALQPTSKSNNDNNNNAPPTVRPVIAKGRRVLAVPLYIRNATTTTTTSSCADDSDDDDSTCTMVAADTTTCLSRADSFLQICPLDDGGIAVATTPEQVNIVYQWSSIGGVVDATNQRPAVIADTYFADLAWDAVALRDIQPGEPLFVALPRDPTTGRLLVPDALFPEKWRALE